MNYNRYVAIGGSIHSITLFNKYNKMAQNTINNMTHNRLNNTTITPELQEDLDYLTMELIDFLKEENTSYCKTGESSNGLSVSYAKNTDTIDRKRNIVNLYLSQYSDDNGVRLTYVGI